MALYFAVNYLLGGAAGPIAAGSISDHLSHAAMVSAGAQEMSEPFRAIGLHDAMLVVPAGLLLSALALLLATRSLHADALAMKQPTVISAMIG